MINLFRAELFKLRKTKYIFVGVLVTAICAIGMYLVSNGMATGKMDINPGSANGLSDIFILSIIGPLMTGLLICSDFDSKDIHDAISCGRKSIVVSKVLVYTIVIALLVLPYAIAALVGFVTQGQFKDVFAFSTYSALLSQGKELADEKLGKAVVMLLVSIVLYAARICVCIPVAFKCKKAVIVTLFGAIFGFVIDFIVSSFSQVKVMRNLFEWTPFAYSKLGLDMSYMKYAKITIVSLVFIVLIAIVTYYNFRKAEIK